MAGPAPDEAMVEHALAALRRLVDAAPSRDAATAALEEIEAMWRRRPFSVGVVGDDVPARTELLNALCGAGMFELEGRAPGCAPVRVRRGAATRFRAARRAGAFEEGTLPDRPPAPAAPRRSRTAVIRTQVGEHEMALLQAERAVPRLARERPPWWAFWLWMIRWLVVRRAQARLAAWQRAKAQLAEAQRELEAGQETIPTAINELPGLRERLERLRVLGSGGIEGRDIREIELEVAGGPLPDEVEVVELAGFTQGIRVDVTVRVARSQVEVTGAGEGARRELGPPALAAPGLARLPIEARARWAAQRAREVVSAEIARLDEAVVRAEGSLRDRLARVETLRMPDAEGFVSAQLARVGPQAAASISAVLEHAGTHLGSELAERAARWDQQIQAAGTPDELKAAAARIDEESVAEYKRISDETRMLVMGGVGGSAHDLLPELFSALRQPGMPDEHAVPPRAVPPLSKVPMLPSLTEPSPSAFAAELSGAGPWLAGLFRSIDARRTELRDKVRQRAERVRAAADAELLNAEPALRAALLDSVGRALAAAVERRVAWLADELAREQLAIEEERAALQPLIDAVERARRDLRGLQEQVSGADAPPRAAAAPEVA